MTLFNINRYSDFINKSEFCIIGEYEKCVDVCRHVIARKERLDTLQLFFPSSHVREFLHEIKEKNIYIEIFLDINQTNLKADFFTEFATVYTIKDNL